MRHNNRPIKPSLAGSSRRDWIRSIAAIAALAPFGALGQSLGKSHSSERIQIGLTPVFLDDQVSFLDRWRAWFENKLARPISFVQRGNYREIVDLVRQDKIDFAWLCGYPYIRFKRELSLVAAPLWKGQPYYQAYLIVPGDDTHTQTLMDLRGKVFAYSDPDSNSGYLYPQFLLTQAGANPARFFSRTFFTWGHRKVVEAVNVGLAAGGAVDGYIWEVLNAMGSPLTRGTRVVAKSVPLGHPPFVARSSLPQTEFDRFRQVLMSMASDEEGTRLLGSLHLDGFTEAPPSLYDGIARMFSQVNRGRPE